MTSLPRNPGSLGAIHRGRGFVVLGLLSLIVGCGPAPTTIAYDTRFGEATELDVFGGDPSGVRPAVMLVHGGGWREGSKSQLAGLARRLVGEGYVAASVNYRLGADGAYPASVADVRCALSYLQNHAAELGIDDRHVAVIGYSAGGHLASMLAVSDVVADCAEPTGARPTALIAAAAPENLAALSWASNVQEYLGAPLIGNEARYAEASPLRLVKSGAPPYLLIHGDADLYVSISHAHEMKAALKAEGNAADLLVIHGGGHVLNPGVSPDQLVTEEYVLDSEEAWFAMREFLKRAFAP